MANNLTKKLDELFKNPSMDKMEELTRETIQFFDQIRTIMETGTEEEKKAAMKESQEMHKKLLKYTKLAYEKSGMSEEEIKKLLEKGNFSADDFRLFKNAEKGIQEFREKPTKRPRTKKHRHKWGEKI
jgi:hypothetical protein